MARYHVNPQGNPGVCRAQHACPYGDFETEHFDSSEDARAAYEAGNLDNAFTTLSKTLDDVMPEMLVTPPNGGKTSGPVSEGAVVLNGPDKTEDDRLLEGIEKAGWPKFDPKAGDDQFDDANFNAAMDEYWADVDRAESLGDAFPEPRFSSALQQAAMDIINAGLINDKPVPTLDPDKIVAASNPAPETEMRKPADIRVGDVVQLDGVDIVVDQADETGFAGQALDGKRYGSPITGSRNSRKNAEYSVVKPDAPAPMTDEQMQEMDAYYQANPMMDVEFSKDPKTNAPTFIVSVNGEPRFKTDREDVAALFSKASKAGVWQKLEAIEGNGKYATIARYVSKGQGYIDDGYADNEDKLWDLENDRTPAGLEAQKMVIRDNRMLDVANAILRDQRDRDRIGRDLPQDTPPF